MRIPNHINSFHWHQSVGYARQVCARIFRDGGTATDAVNLFGIAPSAKLDWSKAVDMIAERLCAQPLRCAA